MVKKVKNYLDLIPQKNYNWKLKDGTVSIVMPHKGFFAYIARHIFKKPEKSLITLDEIGSYIWLNIDGRRNLGEIARLLEGRFSKKVHPLYQRLWQYFLILKKNKFIIFKSGD